MIMNRFFKYLIISLMWYFFYNNINKYEFNNILNNLTTQLKASNVGKLNKYLTEINKDNFKENPIIRSLPVPDNLDLTILYDNNYKKFFLFGFGFTILVYRWLTLIKRLVLWPFKLGIFSFLYSLIGLDVSWFLNLFNIFSLNIPFWVYFQYLTLYNSWLTWWHNTVNIKNIYTIPVKDYKNNLTKNKLNKESIKIEKNITELDNPKSNKVWYIAGVVTVVVSVGFILWYFEIFNLNYTGPGDRPGSGSPTDVIRPRVDEVADQIQITDNQSVGTEASTSSTPVASTSYSTPDPVALINSQMDVFNRNNPYSNSLTSANMNRLNALDVLNEFKRPDSPAGSDDSSSTIRSFIRPKPIIRALRNIGNNNNR